MVQAKSKSTKSRRSPPPCPVAVLARAHADLLAQMEEARDAIDSQEYEGMLGDGLNAIRAAVSHRVPTSAEGLLFLHDCIEDELQFLRDIPSDPKTPSVLADVDAGLR